MSKTQLLSVTRNLCIARKDTQLFDTKMVTIHSTNPRTSGSKNDKQEVLLLLHFWRHLTHSYNTDHEI
jgi:hypothetical protein